MQGKAELITEERVKELLLEKDKILILTHKSPDGDTLGTGTALWRVLQSLGKTARVENSDTIPVKYAYLFDGLVATDFVPEYIIAVDVADPKLLGDKLSVYAERVDLCIDHHSSNLHYATELLCRPADGAAALTLYRVLKLMEVPMTPAIATSLYTGLATDTGCFRYSNTTSELMRAAADLMDAGADHADINVRMFETKSLAYFRLLQTVLAGLRMYCNGQVAVFKVTQDMMAQAGATEDMLDAIAPMSRQIAGVKAGITMKQTADGTYKFSLRTHEPLDASEMGRLLGGGGHARAAGTGVVTDEEVALSKLLDWTAEQLHCEVS